MKKIVLAIGSLLIMVTAAAAVRAPIGPPYTSTQKDGKFTCRFCDNKGWYVGPKGSTIWPDEDKPVELEMKDCSFCGGTGWWQGPRKDYQSSLKHALWISKFNHIPCVIYVNQPDQHPPRGAWMGPAEVEVPEFEGSKTQRVVVLFPVIPPENGKYKDGRWQHVPSREHIRETMNGVPSNLQLYASFVRLYAKEPYPSKLK
jgi:hypothetical protein